MRGQKPFGAFVIRDVCWMHEETQQEPIGINPALPFAPVDLFFPIVAAFSSCFGRFDGLGVQDADGRFRVTVQCVSRQVPQRIIDGDTGSITMGRKRSERNSLAEHRSEACAIGGRCGFCTAGR